MSKRLRSERVRFYDILSPADHQLPRVKGGGFYSEGAAQAAPGVMGLPCIFTAVEIMWLCTCQHHKTIHQKEERILHANFKIKSKDISANYSKTICKCTQRIHSQQYTKRI